MCGVSVLPKTVISQSNMSSMLGGYNQGFYNVKTVKAFLDLHMFWQ